MVSNIDLANFEQVYQRYRVFIMDIDGTLMNGSGLIPGVSEKIFQLMTDESKKVLFFSNGGYCNVATTMKKVVDWLRDDLSAEKFSTIEPMLTKSLVYNTAALTGTWLKTKLEPGAKILCLGNE